MIIGLDKHPEPTPYNSASGNIHRLDAVVNHCRRPSGKIASAAALCLKQSPAGCLSIPPAGIPRPDNALLPDRGSGEPITENLCDSGGAFPSLYFLTDTIKLVQNRGLIAIIRLSINNSANKSERARDACKVASDNAAPAQRLGRLNLDIL